MKHLLRLFPARWAAYVVMFLVLTGSYSIVRAINACGTLRQIYCSLIEIEGELYGVGFGNFNHGDYVRVIGSVECYSGPSPCYETSCFITVRFMALCETTWFIKSDESGDLPTIQAGIDAAANGHTVILGNGIFIGPGNRDLDFHGKAITVMSESGNPNTCIIDCEGSEIDPHRGFYFHTGEGPESVLQGVTIKNGYYGGGGGVRCENSSPTFLNCVFTGNSSPSDGGGMNCVFSSPVLTKCTFSGNSSTDYGGGLYCEGSSPLLTNCTFSDNSAASGGGMCGWTSSSLMVEKTIIAFSSPGEAVYCDVGSIASLNCSDVYGNAGGDWIGCITGQNGINNNFSIDPFFCGGSGSGTYFLHAISPCAPSNNPCGTLIGALPVGCGVIGQLAQCPNDSTIRVFPNTLVLDGFTITNNSPFDLAYDYYLFPEGPATLVDNGDPNSLSGTTRVLFPGESISPPEASIIIPEVEEYSQEFVTYNVSAVGHPEFLDLCTSLITFMPRDSIIMAWGSNYKGKCDVPSPNGGFAAVAGGWGHSLGLKADGRIVAWGSNNYGECDVPSPNEDFISVSAYSEFSLGLKSDGTVVAWGYNYHGACEVPSPNEDFIAISAGYFHSLGLKSDGTIVAWGDNYASGQCEVPSPNENFVAVAGGWWHSLGVKSNGTIVAWGKNYDGQCNVPSPNEGFIAAAGGYDHSLGLTSDGKIVAWGDNSSGQCNVPSPNEGFIAIEAGYKYSLGLTSDGKIVAWGWNHYGQCNVPSPNEYFTALAGGLYHGLGLKSFGQTVVSLDIHPRSCPNPFNIKWLEIIDKGKGNDMAKTKKGGVIPAAIVGRDYFEVSDIDISTLRLEGVAPLQSSLEDITRPVSGREACSCITGGPDGFMDLTLKFSRQEIAASIGPAEVGDVVELILLGSLLDGTPFEASDCVTIVGNRNDLPSLASGDEVVLKPAVPNPFNPMTRISYYLPRDEFVKLLIFDVSGKLVQELVAQQQAAGEHVVEWNAAGIPSGVYFYCLRVGNQVMSKKMVLLK